MCGTDVGLLADIGTEYAAIVPLGNPISMAQAIPDLVDDPCPYEQITNAAFQWILKQDAEWSSVQYQIFLNEVIRQRNGQHNEVIFPIDRN